LLAVRSCIIDGELIACDANGPASSQYSPLPPIDMSRSARRSDPQTRSEDPTRPRAKGQGFRRVSVVTPSSAKI
jgi:hypothetical protein